MAEREIRTVLDGMSYLECPRWHDGRLYVSDFYTRQVLAVDLDGAGEPETVARVPEQPSGLGWMPDGSTLVVSVRDRRILRVRAGGDPEVHADLSALASWHLNDMVVDAEGRAYVGNFGFDIMSGARIRTANVIRVDPDGSAAVAADELSFPNGTVIAPDGRTLVVAETLAGRLTAFDVDDGGALSGRRTWAKLSDFVDTEDFGDLLAAGGVAPDGIALDAEGAIWVADALGGRVIRVREGGRDRRGDRARDRGLRVRPRRRRGPHARHVRRAVVRRARAPQHARGHAPGVRGRRAAHGPAIARGRVTPRACRRSRRASSRLRSAR
jgi:sugar lactone lactonase YvrE